LPIDYGTAVTDDIPDDPEEGENHQQGADPQDGKADLFRDRFIESH
jgi:hypothetical protein